jgi:hypothetical protein
MGPTNRIGAMVNNIFGKGNKAPIINQVSSLINDRYIEDMGLYFDLRLLHPQDFANTDLLSSRVDAIRQVLVSDPDSVGKDFRPTLGLLERQWEAINAEYKLILQSKVYILLYKSGWENGMAIPSLSVYQTVDFVCVPISGKPQEEWPVYSKLEINGLAYRFKRVPKPVDEPIPTPTSTPTPTPTPPPAGLVQGYIVCPHCSGKFIL